MKKNILFLAASLCLVSAASYAQTKQSVTVDVCGKPMVFPTNPQQVVVHDINMTQMMLALGLDDRIKAISGISGWYKSSERAQALLKLYPEIAPKNPTLENILIESPDMFFAGWNYGMRMGGEVSPQSLARFNIPTYILSESCIHQAKANNESSQAASIALLYKDISNLGKIFQVEDKANEVIQGWKNTLQRIAKAQQDKQVKPLNVFLYDSGDDKPITAGKYGMPTALIAAAGGKNIADDIETSWGSMSWEVVAARNPALIIMVDYNQQTSQQVMAKLQAIPAVANTDAVKNNQIIKLGYEELTPGPANIHAIEKIAAQISAMNQE
ncbi:ABC transporter substrate-binding protein [Photobacterium kagoshimensis]|uniref:ABC transporter substrate-binding protein n=1 Tax=Photobacterium kagoshimensis TaxID=2910242 RepID=UPI003D0E354C